ncbi:AMP-dependent synthetase/ligase [Streptomyces sp. HNM0574]|uniref:AMP-dependent synthetase/ligase n=1 Tax=Streptomyces sp. HNM0574 TaxID=2714954 RepID=UPI003217248F
MARIRTGGLADPVYTTAAHEPDLPRAAVRDPHDPGTWHQITAAEFGDRVLALARGFLAEDIRPGDRVAVMSRTRLEVTLLAFALWSLGAELVPLYPTSSPGQLRGLLSASGACAAVVEHEDHAMTLASASDGLPGLRHVWQLDDGCVTALTAAGAAVPAQDVHRHRAAVTPDAPAAVVFTSGTTGTPRGCVLTHANLAAECDTLVAGWGTLMAPPGEQPSVLTFLPTGHVYGLMVVVLCVRGGILLGHQPDLAPAQLLPALASFRPTLVLGVPYVFEKFYARARHTAVAAGRGGLFDRAMDVAHRHAEATEAQTLGTGPGPGPGLRARHALYDRLVYRRMRDVLGGRARNAVSGGSTLSRELGLRLAGAGLTVYDGYGLTETTAAVTGQLPGRPRFGTVGRPLPGTSLRIAYDGEVWVHGDTVFSGYLDDPAGTAEVLHDGWLATGDLGHLDDGHLVITGRKKDVIITSGGKSVSPLALEERLRAHPLISQALVVGDDRPYIAALVTLDPEAVEQWTGFRRPGHGGLAEEELHREVWRAVAAANALVSRAESVRAVRILPHEFTVAAGLVTPSMKPRRKAIVRHYAQEIDDLYARPEVHTRRG